jgi:hypothetical protein
MLRIIVLNYKRPDNVRAICDAFHRTVPITVINNNPYETFEYRSRKVTVINNDSNKYCIERWLQCYNYTEPFKLILDDDLVPSPLLIQKLKRRNQPLIGIYGKSGVDKAKKYNDLRDHWCNNSRVDFLVGSVLMVKQEALDAIKEDLLTFKGLKRGDDIVVSYLVKKYYKLENLDTVIGKVLNLPEGNVGLNRHPDHFKLRWEVLQQCLN